MRSRSLFFILCSAPLMAQIGIGLSPMRVELKIAPGQGYSGALELTNEAGGRMRIRAELLDFGLDQTMTPQFARNIDGEKQWSCRDWLTLNPMESEIGDGEKLLIRYTIRVPKDAAAKGYHCAAGFTSLPPVSEAKVTGIRNTVRAITAFYAILGASNGRGEVTGLSIERTGNEQSAVLVVRNETDYHIRPEGDIEVISADGTVIETQRVPSFPVLPKRTQRLVVPIKTGPAGIAVVRAKVELGTNEIQEAAIRVVTNGEEGK